MADAKITDLATAGALSGTDLLLLSQAGADKKLGLSALSAYVPILRPSWAMAVDNLAATPTFTGGTAVTSSATPNTDGTPVTLLPALAQDCEYLSLSMLAVAVNTANTSALVDILVDPAGGTSWQVLIEDLLCGYGGAINGVLPYGPSHHYDFPIWIPAGASIGAQMRSANASFVNNVIVRAFGGNTVPGSWNAGTVVTTVGTMSPSTSRGQAHTVGASGTMSSWANLGSVLPANAIAWQVAAQGIGTGGLSNVAYLFEFGAASTRIGPRKRLVTGTGEGTASWPTGIAWNAIASGTQLQVRGTCSTTASSPDVAAYVVS